MATYKNGATYFIHANHLGTERVRRSVTANVIGSCVSVPFGDGLSCTGTDTSPLHFTGKERDAESGNDDFGARFYSSRFGRWLSADWSAAPVPVPYANLANPQTLNLYAMVSDNPETFADLDGHQGVQEATAVSPTDSTTGNISCDGNAVNCATGTTLSPAQDTPAAQMSSLQFFGAEVKGVWDSTGGAVLGLGASLLSGEGEKNIATTAEWAVTSPGKIGEAVKEAGHEAQQTQESAASGNPRHWPSSRDSSNRCIHSRECPCRCL